MQVQQLGPAEGQLYTICKWLDQLWHETWHKVLQGHYHHLVVMCPDTPQRGAAPLLYSTLQNCAEHTTEFIASQDKKAIWLSFVRIGWAACKDCVGVFFSGLTTGIAWYYCSMPFPTITRLFTSRKLSGHNLPLQALGEIPSCLPVWTLQSEPEKRFWQIGGFPRLCRDTCKYGIPNRSLRTATHFSRLNVDLFLFIKCFHCSGIGSNGG